MTTQRFQQNKVHRPGTARSVLLLSLTVLALSVTVLAACGSGSNEGTARSLGKAPAISLPDQNGVVYTLNPEACRPTVIVFYMGYFWGACRFQLGELAKNVEEITPFADVVAISIDPQSESAKTASLIGGKVRLLSDPEMKVIRDYKMEGVGMANMGYVVVDGRGEIIARQVDPLFGTRMDKFLELVSQCQA